MKLTLDMGVRYLYNAGMSNWAHLGTSYYRNSLTGCSVYKNGRGEWYARNERTAATNGPHKTKRAAILASYELL